MASCRSASTSEPGARSRRPALTPSRKPSPLVPRTSTSGIRSSTAPTSTAPPPSAYTNGVVTPHASFLGLRWDREAVLANLDKLRRDFDIYSKWGFRDSVDVGTGGSIGVVAQQQPPDHRGVVS